MKSCRAYWGGHVSVFAHEGLECMRIYVTALYGLNPQEAHRWQDF